jgi:hypothetical protein
MMEQAQKKPHRKLYSSLAISLLLAFPLCAQQRRARRHNPHLPRE